MWTCAKCGEKIQEQFDSCWKCSAPRAGTPSTDPREGKPAWRMSYQVFRGTFATWDELFAQAAEFATNIGPERVISISHSEDDSDGVVAVWYWTDETEAADGKGEAG